MSQSFDTDYVAVTELSGEEVSAEQVERLARRYYWAAEYCRDRDVLEVACGSGQGVGYLAAVANSITAGDVSEQVLSIARRHYGTRFEFRVMDAQQLPFADNSFDVVLLFEAIYYLREPRRFFSEAHRVLRPGGKLLIATANKDLFEFTPSPYSHRYLGIVELERELKEAGFATDCFGDTHVGALSLRQRLLRPVKALASRLGFIPKTMAGKQFLKRLVFGRLIPMPGQLTSQTAAKIRPVALSHGRPDHHHKVILCCATRQTT